MQESESYETIGNYATEKESVAHFDELIERTGLFTVKSEVDGYLLHPRPGAKFKEMRIDRLLLPKLQLTALGWKRGAIGVECKRSDMKVGPALAQATDYARTVWVSPENGLMIMTGYIFLWPLDEINGTVHSMMQQQLVGGVYLRNDEFDGEALLFHLGSRNCILEYKFQTGKLFLGNSKSGRKAGSR